MTNFTELFEDCTSKGRKIKKEDYLENGKYPIIDQGQEQIAGYSDDEQGLFTEVPAIVFGDHTRIIKYIHEPFFLGADGVKVLRCKNDDANYKYLYYALKNAKIPNTGYNRHFKWLKETKIAYPDIIKQDQITLILDKLSKIIDYRKQQLDDLDNLIKSRFVEIFGDLKNIHTVKLGEVSKITGGLTKNAGRNKISNKMPYLRVANVYFNKLDLNEIHLIGVRENEIEKTLLQKGDLLFVEGNGSIEQIGRVAVWDGSINPILHQNHLIKARFNEMIILSEYALYYFMSKEGRNQIIAKSVSTSGLNTLSVKKIQDLNIPMPPIDVQKEFITFVYATDKLKVEVNESLYEIQLLFDSLMQTYFEQ